VIAMLPEVRYQPHTRFDGLPGFEATVAQEVARYRQAIDKEIGQTEKLFHNELNRALRTFRALRQNAASADEIAKIDETMADVCCGFTVIRLEERARVWATAISALEG
jgi:hypothetical protein